MSTPHPLIVSLAALVALAADLQGAGAIRSEHDAKWQTLRVGLDQAAGLAAEAQAPAVTGPDAAAFGTLSVLVHLVSDKIDGIAAKVGA